MTATRLPRVSVLIVTRDRKRDVLQTLTSLEALEYPLERLEVLVLDNGSSDGTEPAVRHWLGARARRFAGTQCLRSPENLGASAARNVLASRASPDSDLWFVLDDDAIPEPAFLQRMVATLGVDRLRGVAGGRIVAFDDPARELAGAGFVDWRLGRFREVAASTTLRCDFVITCAAVIRPEAFRAAGGFDEDYFVYHEDVDFCVRVGRRGFGIFYEPAAVARHKVGPGKTRTPERLYYLLRNKLLFLRKHVPVTRHPLAWLVSGAVLIPRMVAQSIALHRRLSLPELRTILRAGFDGWRGKAGRWHR